MTLLKPLLDRRKKGCGIIPSTLTSTNKSCVGDTRNLRPLCHGLFLAPKCHVDGVLFVPRLLFSCCPATIAWLVIAVHVNAINRVFRGWAAAHVFKECRKGISPTIANRNSPSAIAAIASRGGVGASGNHCVPRLHLRRWLSMNIFAMLDSTCAAKLRLHAPTTLLAKLPQCLTKHFCFFPATAPAKPSRLTDVLHGGQVIKGLASKVNECFRVGFHSNILYHHTLAGNPRRRVS